MECRICGTALESRDTGRPARYCSQACRQRAYRARRTRPASPAADIDERRREPRRKTAPPPLRERAVPHLTFPQLQAWRGTLEMLSRLLPELEAELRRETGLTINEFDVLYQLWRAPDRRRRVGDLANDVLVTPGGATRLADRLVERGLVERHRQEGRQAVELSLTSVGRRQIHELMDVMFRGVRTKFIDPLEPEDVDHLVEIWARLEDHCPADGS
jgi:DNA-binding MarR family transcriptional regulator